MAIEKDCLQCKGYNSSNGICNIKWELPIFDGSECDNFQSRNSVLLHEESSINIERDQDQRIIVNRKRGKSVKHRNVNIAYGENGDEYREDVRAQGFPFGIPESILRNTLYIASFFLLISIGYGAYWYYGHSIESDRADIVWKAISELELLRVDKTVNYLVLNDIKYDDGQLNLKFIRNGDNSELEDKDPNSIIQNEMASYVVLAPHRWDSICKIMEEAKVDIQITFSNVVHHPSVVIPYDELRNILLNDSNMAEGLNLFVKKKAIEVMSYAKKHFRRDFIKADALTIDDDYVTLRMTYDDRKAMLGASFSDTSKVNSHFTDPVGDMGSILDGMLSISTRTNKGVSFVYTGTNSKKITKCSWSADRIKELVENNKSTLLISGRKTNQVHSTIGKTNSVRKTRK